MLNELKKLTVYRNTIISSIMITVIALFFLYRMGGIVRHLPFARDFYTPVFFLVCFPIFLLFPLLSLPVMQNVERFGLGFGRWKVWLVDVAFLYGGALLFIFPTVKLGILGDTYPLWKDASLSLSLFLFYETTHFIYLFACEFLFRGFFLFSLKTEIGDAAAVCMQMVPFVILHAGKPEIEAYGTIVGGLILGIMAVRGRSMWPCAILHFLIALTIDIAVIITT
jgi:membrane protease YdiL (CAAX protease family)